MFQNPVGWTESWAESTAVLMPRPRKLTSGTRKRMSINRQKIKSGAKAERERKSGREERRTKRNEWLQMRREQGTRKVMQQREEEIQRGERRAAKPKSNRIIYQGNWSKEDGSFIQGLLMKKRLHSKKVAPKERVERVARREVTEPKWNGLKVVAHEERAGKARQEKKRLKRKETDGVENLDEMDKLKPGHPEAANESAKMDVVTEVQEKERSEDDLPDLAASSNSSMEQADSDNENQYLMQQRTRKYVKRRGKQTNPPASSSDEDEEPLEHRRRKSYLKCASPAAAKEEVEVAGISEEIKISSECHTFNNLLAKQKRKDDEIQADLTETSEEEPDEVLNVGGGMRGGAGDGYEDVFLEAINKSGERLQLDNRTRGDGNCGPRALVQQCQRPPVKLFLQARGVTIHDFKELKDNVAQFISENSDHEKIQHLRGMFELSQKTIHNEEGGLRKRSWKKYWSDMTKDAGQERSAARWKECWADDIWLTAAAYYLNMRVRVIWAGDDTGGQIVSDVDGDWVPVDEEKPILYLGYITGVNGHYQSLLPRIEDHPTPAYLQPEAIDNALAGMVYGVMQDLEAELKQVSLSSKNVKHNFPLSCYLFLVIKVTPNIS